MKQMIKRLIADILIAPFIVVLVMLTIIIGIFADIVTMGKNEGQYYEP